MQSMPVSFTLDDAAAAHAEFPDTFHLPAASECESLRSGDFAKLMFRISDGENVHVERMWVRVQQVKPETYVGVLDNDAYCTEALRVGMPVEFHSDHVIQIRRNGSPIN
jgi:hypothetical protein